MLSVLIGLQWLSQRKPCCHGHQANIIITIYNAKFGRTSGTQRKCDADSNGSTSQLTESATQKTQNLATLHTLQREQIARFQHMRCFPQWNCRPGKMPVTLASILQSSLFFFCRSQVSGFCVTRVAESLARLLERWECTTDTAQAASTLYTANWSSGLNGWSEFPGFQDWKVDGGMLRDDGTNSSLVAPGIEAPYEVTRTSDYAVETEMQAVKAGQPCFDITTIRTNAQWFGYKAVVCQGLAMIRKVNSTNSADTIAGIAFDPKTDWHTYRLEAKGLTIRLLIDGSQVLQVNDSTYLSGGKLGMNSYQTQLNVRSYKVFAI